MNKHPYLRAYMAGSFVPTLVFLLVMVAFTFFRYVYNVPVPIERVIVFPLTIVPNAWGVWNVLHLAVARRVPIGMFGAILPLLLVPGGWFVAHAVHFAIPAIVYHAIPFTIWLGVAVYYLVWKYVVASLNAIVGLP